MPFFIVFSTIYAMKEWMKHGIIGHRSEVMHLETIAAISTAYGTAGISVIRVSGNDAIIKINQIFRGKDLTKVKSHTVHYGFIVDKDSLEKSKIPTHTITRIIVSTIIGTYFLTISILYS